MGWSSSSALQVNHPEFYQLDLGAIRDVRSVVLYPRTDAGNVGQGFPVDFSIQVSVDGLLWTTVLTRTDLSVPNVGEAFTFGPRSARHVRVDMTRLRGSNPNDPTYRAQLAEVEVY